VPQHTLVLAACGMATKKKQERSAAQKVARIREANAKEGGEEEGIFKGKITALLGSSMQVCRVRIPAPPPGSRRASPSYRSIACALR